MILRIMKKWYRSDMKLSPIKIKQRLQELHTQAQALTKETKITRKNIQGTKKDRSQQRDQTMIRALRKKLGLDSE